MLQTYTNVDKSTNNKCQAPGKWDITPPMAYLCIVSAHWCGIETIL